MATELYREVLLLLLASPSDQDCRQDVGDIYDQLKSRGWRLDVSSVDQLRAVLQNCTQLFRVDDQGYVSPQTTLTICATHSNKSGSCPEGTCMDLHFCIFYLLSGTCRHGDRCHFGHDLNTRHNRYRLQSHLLQDLSMTELRILFRLKNVRRGVTIPQVCRYFNKSLGCIKGNDCRSLHLCLHYVSGMCKYSTRCVRNHDINSRGQVIEVLQLYGVKTSGRKVSDILDEVRFYSQQYGTNQDMRDNRTSRPPLQGGGARPKRFGSVPGNMFERHGLALASDPGAGLRAPSPSRRPRNISESAYTNLTDPAFSAAKTDELCIYFLKGECRFGEDCICLHSSDPYLWRVQRVEERSDGEAVSAEWTRVPSDVNQRLELAYSQPAVKTCTVTDGHGEEIEVEFRGMTARNERNGQQFNVRRLSTLSFKNRAMKGCESNLPFATVWRWYWRNEDGTWTMFGREEGGSLGVSSDEVEEHYQQKVATPLTFNHFVLDLSKKRLKDKAIDRRFKVIRRPQFVPRTQDVESVDSDIGFESDDDEEERGASVDDDNFGINLTTANDTSQSVTSHDWFLRPLHFFSQHFVARKQRFTETLGVSCQVLGINKVCNSLLEEEYNSVKLSVNRRKVKEMWLYYGPTPLEDISAICARGFNPSSPGAAINGTTLGKGGYFHINASRANKRVGGVKKERQVFVAKGLVDRKAKDISCFVEEESTEDFIKYGMDDWYDSKTFVINANRVYPTYLITYQLL